MKIQIFDDHTDLAFDVADMLCRQIARKPDSVICFAAGTTPLSAYNIFTTLVETDAVDCRHITLIGLDEWVGIPPENTGSCAWFLRRTLIKPLNLSADRFRLFDGMSVDLDSECALMDEYVSGCGGIDLMVVGIGMNGHIGFNEPGGSPVLRSHVTPLNDVTSTVGQKYFTEKTELTKGITLGLGHLQDAANVILMASGENKARIMRETLEGEISIDVPASIVRKHRNSHVLMDQAAASLLSRRD